MTPYKILIVEDEILIADNITHFLTKNGHQVLGTAISYEEAFLSYQSERPDLVLLDIRLNGPKTGIDFAHFITRQTDPAAFIFLTSQLDRENINKAKETYPAGYLSKPIIKNNLLASIEIAMHKFDVTRPGSSEQQISLGHGAKKQPVFLKDILYIESEHVYIKVHHNEGEPILQRNSLKEIQNQLPSNQFIQVHRSFVINKDNLTHWDTKHLYIGDHEIPVSRGRRKEILGIVKY